MAIVSPSFAKQWHPIKNGKLTPFDVSKGSNKKVWWKCDKGEDHEWEAFVNSRTGMNLGCPICSNYKVVNSNCLTTVNSELSKQWHPTKNGNLNPSDYTYGSKIKVWWKCNKGDDHEWSASISNRSRLGRGCAICAGKKVVYSNSLLKTHPKLAARYYFPRHRNARKEWI